LYAYLNGQGALRAWVLGTDDVSHAAISNLALSEGLNLRIPEVEVYSEQGHGVSPQSVVLVLNEAARAVRTRRRGRAGRWPVSRYRPTWLAAYSAWASVNPLPYGEVSCWIRLALLNPVPRFM